MANEIQTENIKAFQKAVAENRVEQARLDTDGAITINQAQGKLTSVDIADVDLVLGFDDGSFVIIPSGALDAAVNTPHTVIFTETKDTLANLFKMAGLSNPAKAGSLRVVTENVDAARLIEEEPGRPAADEYQSPELPAPPAPIAKVSAGASLGKGPGLGGNGSGEGEGEVPATVSPTITPQPPVYRTGTATQTPVTQPDFGDSGPPVVTAAMYTSSSFKVTPSGRTDLPAGAYDPALANDPTALAVHSSPANQAVIEKIYGTAGNDVIDHNSSFNNSSDPAIWSKSIHLSFSNFATVETVTLTLNATQIAKIAGFNLEGTGVNKVAGFANVWTVDLTQHPDYKANGIDVAVRYPVGDAVSPVDFIADLSVHGTGQVASGELIPVDLTSQMKISWRNAATADDFNVVDATDNSQMMVLPAAGLGYEIFGGDGNDEIHAGAGNDILHGGKGADKLDGGIGSDTATYIDIDAVTGITADLAQIANNSGEALGDEYTSIENLEGSTCSDILRGDSGVNRLTGLAGDDTLEGRGGVYVDSQEIAHGDILDGGAGNDTASYTSDTTGVTVSLLTNTGTNGDASGDTLISIENLTGGSGNDTLIGNDGDNILTGNAGNDTLTGGLGADSLYGGDGTDTADYSQATAPVVVTLVSVAGVTQSGEAEGDTFDSIENIVGTAFGDHLIGSSVANQLSGGTGNDLLEGLGGSDKLIGGDGNDTASYAHAGAVSGSTGITASLTVSSGFTQGAVPTPSGDAAGDTYDSIENLEGSTYNDTLIGNGNANILTGGTGNDTLEGMAGSDQLRGDGGINTASYEHWEGAFGAGVIASLTNPASNTGDAAGDTYFDIQNLTGSNFNDTLTGDSGSNTLNGGAGDDTLEGMAEADILHGGVSGSDTAVYSQATTAITASLMDASADNSGTDAAGDTYISIENLTGSSHDDTLIGKTGSNILNGGSGNDTLEGMGSADRLIGGEGDHDVASYSRAGLNSSSSDTTAIGLGVTATLTSVFNAGVQVSGSGDAAGDIYSGIEDLTGSSYNDTLIGDSADNILTGGQGNDKLEGMAGADKLVGGVDSDVNNTASYAHAGAISGGTGVTVSLVTPTTSNTGDAFGDTYQNIRNLEGSTFDDRLQGDEHDNALSGLSGDDIIEGMAGADALTGGAGSNTASYVNAVAVSGSIGVTASLLTPLDPTGNTGDATGDTYVQIQNLLGSVYDDTLIGDAGDNRLDGNDGNDLLVGGVGADQLVGGSDSQTGNGSTLAGGDTAGYSTSSQDVVASLTTGFDFGPTIYQSGDAYGDSFSGIENLSGSSLNDTLIGNSGKNILSGSDGNDTLEGMGGADRLIGGIGSNTASYAHAGYTEPTQTTGVTASLTDQSVNTGDAAGDHYEDIQNLLGSDYNDTLIGNTGDNTLSGGKGNDILEGLGGDDYLAGGAGSDYASYANAATDITASLTDPTQNSIGTDAEGDTYDSIENLIGSTHNDILIGNSQANILLGGADDDVLEGMAGADQLDGGAGNNTASYEHWVDTSGVGVVASLSNPSINTGDAAGDIYLNNSIQNLTGSYLSDTLIGNSGVNILTGGVGNDLLEGKEGADQLIGGANSDTASYVSAASTDGSNAGVTVSLLTSSQNTTLGIVMNGDAAYTDPTTHVTTFDTFDEIENLTGSIYNDTLIGRYDANILTGGDGNDILEGMADADQLIGGGGVHDVASYAHAGLIGTVTGVGVIASLTSVFTSGATVTASGDAYGDTYSGIEDLTGSGYDDTLIGNSGNNIITGGAGVDKLEGMGGADTLIGGGTGDTDNTASYAHANAISGSTGVYASLLTPLDGSDNTGDAKDDTYTNIRHLEGSTFDDTLQGDENANTLTGLAGDDILEGMGEADRLDGGSGNNTASYEHSPHDTAGAQVGVIASLTTNAGTGADAQGDTFVAGTIQNLIGSGFDDQLTGNAENNRLNGLAGNDLLEGMAGTDRLDGGEGNDTLIGGSGADQLVGGIHIQTGSGISLTGGDTASYAGGSAVLASLTTDFVYGQTIIQTGDAYNDTFEGIENLTGSSGNDTLIGNSEDLAHGISGMNILNGGNGDDVLEGLGGADRLIGGTGSDLNNTASYAHAGPTGVTATLKTISGVTSTGDAAGDAYQNISNLLGSNYNDTLIGNDDANTLTGGLGDDTLEGLALGDSLVGGDGVDTASYAHAGTGVTASLNDHTQNSATTDAAGDTYSSIENLLGSNQADILIGDAGANQLDGGLGDDTLEGLGGADILKGGGGTDTATYASATGYVKVSMLTDITGEGDGAGDKFELVENLVGSNFADILIGDNVSAGNRITGGAGNDILEGRGGADILDGGADNDTVSYEHSPVFNSISGEGVTASLTTNTGSHADAEGDSFANIENLTGSAFNDTLTGDAYANTLIGGAGDDTLSGLGGVDTIYGGIGNDSIIDDGTGEAKLYGEAGDDTFHITSADTYQDFIDGGDKSALRLSNTWAGSGDTISWEATTYNRIDVNMSTHVIYVRSPVSGNNIYFNNIENFTVTGNNTIYVTVDNYSNIVDATSNGTANIDYVLYSNAVGSVAIDLRITNGINVTGGSSVLDNYDSATRTWTGSGDTLKGIEYVEYGSNYADNIYGSDGVNNRLAGSFGADYINGGTGSDTVYLDPGRSNQLAVVASLLNVGKTIDINSAMGIVMTDTAQGDVYVNMENLWSSGASDQLYGNADANVLIGNGIMEGFRGADVINSQGSTNATASYANAGNTYLVAQGISTAVTDNLGVTANLTSPLGSTNFSSYFNGVSATSGLGVLVVNTGDAFQDSYTGNVFGLKGSAYNDILIGNTLNNTITGGDGDDLLEGLAGADYYNGGNGIDTVSYAHATTGVMMDLGTSGSYVWVDMALAAANDALTVTSGKVTAVDTYTGIENIIGSTFADTLAGNSLANTMEGGAGDDFMDGGSNTNGYDIASYAHSSVKVTVDLGKQGMYQVINVTTNEKDKLTNFEGLLGSVYDDTLTGDGANNWIDGGAGADTLDGGAGTTDTLSYASSLSGVTITLNDLNSDHTISTSNTQGDSLANFENLIGSDSVSNGDELHGDGKNNVIEGGLGDDKLYGEANEAGGDTASYEHAAAGVVVSLALQGSEQIVNTVTNEKDTLYSFENLIGSAYSDILTGDATSNIISGGSGNDLLYASAGGDTLAGGDGTDTVSFKNVGAVTVTINGSADHDSVSDTLTGIENVVGSTGSDTINGDGGDNLIDGGGGNDVIDGKAGNDTITFASATVAVNANLDTYSFSGYGSSFSLFNIENVIGSVGDDTLTGDNTFDNIIEGGAGADIMDGKGNSAGGDTASYAGSDAGVSVTINATSDNTGGHAEGDQLFNFENLTGSNGNDSLTGDSFANIINGGSGDDLLIGGAGGDKLYGGTGNDTVSYAGASTGVAMTLGRTGMLPAAYLGDAIGDTFNSIENVTGSSHADTLYGSSESNIIHAGGNDSLTVNDIIYASDGNDIIYANEGGRVSAYGEANNDTFYVSASNQPILIDGGGRDLGNIQNHGGNVIILQDLVDGGSYTMASHLTDTNSRVVNIDTLNIDDSKSTNMTISSQDVRYMVDNTNSSQLFIEANNGDTLNLSLLSDETVAFSQVTSAISGNGTYTDYTIFNASNLQVAQIHWHSTT